VQKQPKDILTVKKDRNMIDKLKAILTEYVDIDPDTITEDTNIRSDLGLNSLELVNIAVAVENTFDVEIPDREISRIETVKDVIDVLTEYIDEE
jgi:acyl carrier protein